MWSRFKRWFNRQWRDLFGQPVVRVWRVGSQDDIEALRNLISEGLECADGFDLVWDATIDVVELFGDGKPNIVVGPGIRVTREGDVIKVMVEDQPAGE